MKTTTPDPKSEEKKPEPRPTIKLVFAGAVLLTDKKKGGRFYSVTDEQLKAQQLPKELPPELIFSWKFAKDFGRPGTVYEVDYQPKEDDNMSVFIGTGRYKGRLSEDPRLLQWQAEHDALLVRIDLDAREKKEKGIQVLADNTLEEIRRVYRKQVGRNRTIFLTQIMQYLMGGKKDE